MTTFLYITGGMLLILVVGFILLYIPRGPKQTVEGPLVLNAISDRAYIRSEAPGWAISFTPSKEQRESFRKMSEEHAEAENDARVRVTFQKNIYGGEIIKEVELLEVGKVGETK